MKTFKFWAILFVIAASIYACGKDDDPISNDDNIIIPTRFTPDGDGVDDFWMVKDSLNLIDKDEFNAKIYDTAHKLVFNKFDKNEAWAGTTSTGTPCDTGYYYFSVKYKTWTGLERLRTGSVFLSRRNPL
jgi:gliding motility-associated-like protein